MKRPPKNFEVLASSPTWEGIQKSITRFYCGASMKAGEKQGDVFPLFNSNGKQISTSVLETERGFYFGFFAQP